MNIPYIRTCYTLLDLVDAYQDAHWGQSPSSYEELMKWVKDTFIVITE